ncbi:ATPase family gene 2 protein homolog A [Phlebotomus argentipes]|uniref:ATPase family gene 2 protein homolog A n=1 Tax=Phlebotomus argentipes TaxID=94469 RepID=UPI002892DDB7|nr:ATPase family gene 2 protein homolog A [Phlebotomus argentipes]XP_059613310.1 ATPase family gene 2 protein homolog A [Phlebotomus argentipes]XP_059613311.1 ATPase family gene 2 protein homolog A [Phlebotomus argentipes]
MSAKKQKSDTVFWYKCEQCQVFITSKHTASHAKFCPISPECRNSSFISSRILYTSEVKSIPTPEAATELDSSQISKLIFVGSSAMQLCGWFSGDEILISVPEIPDFIARVRRIFPQSVDSFATINFTENEFKQNWTNYQDKQLKISSIPSDILPAEKIEFILNEDEEIGEKHLTDLLRNLKFDLKNWIVFKGSQQSIKFYGRNYNFTVKSINSDDLIEKLNRLDINKAEDSPEYYRILQSTRFFLSEKCIKREKKLMEEENTDPVIGGMDKLIEEAKGLMNPVLRGKSLEQKARVCHGILFHGPAGCGKTLLCNFLASTSNAKVVTVNPHRIFSKYLGEAEVTLTRHFQEAYTNFPDPTVIVIDDIHILCPKSESTDAIRRVSAALLRILDELPFRKDAGRIFVLAATTDLEKTNPALQRSGRLDCTMEISAPSPNERLDILKKFLLTVPNSLTEEEIRRFADVTHAFVGADLSALVGKAMGNAAKRSSGVTANDVNWALSTISPSAMKEVLVEVPNVKWADICGQHELKLKLKQAIEWPLTNPEVFPRFGIDPPRGVLMYGPPGCSKTMIAKALATESRLNFLTIKGPDIFSMWVGESERAVRELFRKARSVAPSIVFFDEIDAIGAERGSESGSSVKERVLAQLLTELDGVTSLDSVTIVAATNRPDLIDRALLRPGRIDRIVFVGLPDKETRREIFEIKLRKMPVGEDCSVQQLVELTEKYSGAEIQAVCREAGISALEESLEATEIHWRHFQHALEAIRPRTSPELLKIYEDYERDFQAQQ